MSHPITVESAGGEYMETVVVVAWAVGLGEPVKVGDTIVTIETAKAATDIEASHDGYLTEILYSVGSEAPLGAVLGTIGETSQAPARPAEVSAGSGVAADDGEHRETSAAQSAPRVLASPLARRNAKAAGIDLTTVRGTGPKGLIKQRDVDAVVAKGGTTLEPERLRHTSASKAEPSTTRTGRDDLPPLVLLHGLGADRFAWRWVTPLLNCANRVVTLELPGHGDRTADAARSMESILFSLSDQLEALGIERAHLVGHSLGGAVALNLTQLGRVEVLSLGLVAPAGLGPEINGAFLHGLINASSAETLTPWLKLMVSRASTLPVGSAAAIIRQREKTGGNAAQAAILEQFFPGGTQALDLRETLHAVNVPMRIIWGKDDAIIPVSHTGAAPSAAGLHLLDGVGHTPPMECPGLLAKIVTELVRSAG